MIDWTSSMSQTFEYFIVDPLTWKDTTQITTVTSSSIDRDSGSSTLESASINCDEDLGECYIRVYLVSKQNKETDRRPLGTFLVQTPGMSFDGKRSENELKAYSPLLELNDKLPPYGYSILKESNILNNASRILTEQLRAPLVSAANDDTLTEHFIAESNESWLAYVTSLMAQAKHHLELDENGKVLMAPNQELDALRPVWDFDDGNSSILLPSIKIDKDIYGVPNVVEVVYSTSTGCVFSKAVNDDPNSPVSTVSRGREVHHRVTDLKLPGDPNTFQDKLQEMVDKYAVDTLKKMSTINVEVSFSHGFCPVRVGDCVMLNYTRAGILNFKAKITRQSIECKAGCTIEETAVGVSKLWG